MSSAQGLLDFIQRRAGGNFELTNDEILTARTGAFADTLQVSHAMRCVQKSLGSAVADVIHKSQKGEEMEGGLQTKVSGLHRQLLSDWYLRLFSSLELPELLTSIAMKSKTFEKMNESFDPGVKGTQMRSELLLDEGFVQQFWSEASPHLAEKTLEAFRAKKSFTDAVSTGKFSQDVQLGSTATFYLGLDGVIGLPRLKFLEAMMEEHSSRETFRGYNQGRERNTSPKDEFDRILPKGIGGKIDTLSYDKTVNCCKDSERWEDHPRAQQSKLLKAELVALRLYTSPMYTKYNAVLRELLHKYLELRAEVTGADAPDEAETLLEAQKAMKIGGEGSYVTTIHAIASGLIKIARHSPEQGKVYRGIHGRNLPDCFLRPTRSGGRGGVEYGFLSTSKRKEEAIRYASAGGDAAMPIVFEILLGMVDRGADLEWITYFPGEDEICLPPLSNLELSGLPRYEWVDRIEDGGVSVVEGADESEEERRRRTQCLVMILPLQANVNFKGYTLDELEERRKLLHIRTFQNLLSEVVRDFRKSARLRAVTANLRNSVLSGAAVGRSSANPLVKSGSFLSMSADKSVVRVAKWTESILNECNAVLEEHKANEHEHFNDDGRYKQALDQALGTKVQAQRKFNALVQRHKADRTADLKDLEQAPLRAFTTEADYYPLLSGLRDFPWREICERHAAARRVRLEADDGRALTATQLRLALQCVTAHAQAVESVAFAACVLKADRLRSFPPRDRSTSPRTPEPAPAPVSLSFPTETEVVSFGPLVVAMDERDDGDDEGGGAGGRPAGLEPERVTLRGQRLGGDGGRLMAGVLAGCGRLTALDLAGSALFSAGCEALAPALARVTWSLTTLNLTRTRMGLSGGAKVLGALKGAAALTWLSIRHNAVTADGWSSLVSVLGTATSLSHLDLSYCALNPPAAPLIQALTHLTSLGCLGLRGSVLEPGAASALGSFLTQAGPALSFNDEAGPREGGGIPGAEPVAKGEGEFVRVGFGSTDGAASPVAAQLRQDANFNNKRNSDAVKVALKAGPERCLPLVVVTPTDEINGRDQLGRTSLWRACEQDDEVVVQALIELKADVNVASNDGRTPVAAAAGAGADSVVEALLAAGADPHLLCEQRLSPLHRAAMQAPDSAMGSLLPHMSEGEVNALSGQGLAALHYAARHNSPGSIANLLEHRARIDVRSSGQERTALMEAAASDSGQLEGVEVLLAHAAPLEDKDSEGRTALMVAAAEGKAAAVRLLMERGAMTQWRDAAGMTALVIATQRRHREVVEVLREGMPDADSTLAREMSSESMLDGVRWLASPPQPEDDDKPAEDDDVQRIAPRKAPARLGAAPQRLGAAPPPPPPRAPLEGLAAAPSNSARADAAETAVEPGGAPFPPQAGTLPWPFEEVQIAFPPPFWAAETQVEREGEGSAPVQCTVM